MVLSFPFSAEAHIVDRAMKQLSVLDYIDNWTVTPNSSKDLPIGCTLTINTNQELLPEDTFGLGIYIGMAYNQSLIFEREL